VASIATLSKCPDHEHSLRPRNLGGGVRLLSSGDMARADVSLDCARESDDRVSYNSTKPTLVVPIKLSLHSRSILPA